MYKYHFSVIHAKRVHKMNMMPYKKMACCVSKARDTHPYMAWRAGLSVVVVVLLLVVGLAMEVAAKDVSSMVVVVVVDFLILGCFW